ncbi:MAG: diphthine--ammonia ligase [Nanoarchaeota archaeon]|nr:diphthine--ammonia ligase [Nanoarchaeota archaeon]
MCGIIGIFNQKDKVNKIIKGFEIIKERGNGIFCISDSKKRLIVKNLKDLKIYETKEEGILGNNQYSTTNFMPQPIQGKKSMLIANCRIYNWEILNEKYKLDAKNDSDLLLKILDEKGLNALEELDGVYAFAYLKNKNLYLARDIFGVKPLWLSKEKGLFFCSESKVLTHFKQEYIQELNPRQILIYGIEKNETKYIERKFFSIKPALKKSLKQIKMELQGLIVNAISKRIPNEKFGILFSGGLDSVVIAFICKKLGVDFTCYTSVFYEKGLKKPEDLEFAEIIAKELGFELKVKQLNKKQVEKYLKKVIPLIEDNTVVKTGVALTFYAACELAKKDKIKVIFSGLGSEEIFAGYARHKNSADINKECLSGLKKIYERDNYRDDVITMHNNLELRIPFMDLPLCDYALKIPAKHKYDGKLGKIILRQIAKDMGLKKEYADRPKKSAQYGSRFDKALKMVAKKNGFKHKSEYLRHISPKNNLHLAVLFSSGKDSCLALHVMRKMNYKIDCLVTIKSKNPDSFMYHTPNIDLAKLQAEAMELPIIIQETEGEKEKELNALKEALLIAKQKFPIAGVVTGALFSTYQKTRIEKTCEELGLKCFSPLWHMDQKKEMQELLKQGFEFIFSSIAADGLDKSWLGRLIKKTDIEKLVELNNKNEINIAGEGGEFESLVLNCPEFFKKIKIIKSEIKEENKNTAKFLVKKTSLS